MFKALALSSLLIASTGIVNAAPEFYPVVDLGYVRQKGTTFNQATGFYAYRNIRYAAPPLGERRFKKPEPPLNEDGIQKGDTIGNRECVSFMPEVDWPPFPPTDLGDEDCLMLDVFTPSFLVTGQKVPVIVWVHDGLNQFGSKSRPDPEGLITSLKGDPIVLVSINYRLGAFGWLAPEVGEIPANLGLYDIKAALNWVKKYISRFSGDPNQVTVMGAGSGGGSILNLLGSYGGRGGVPFQKVITFSGGYNPEIKRFTRKTMYESFMDAAGCTTVACLQEADTEVLKKANAVTTTAWYAGELPYAPGWTPVTDGDLIPESFVSLVRKRKLHKLVSIVLHNQRKEMGDLAYPPDMDAEQFTELIKSHFPHADDHQIATIQAAYDGEGPTAHDGAVEYWGDVLVNCHQVWLADAYAFKSYRYVFNLSPNTHGHEFHYTFYDGHSHDPDFLMNDGLARSHQKIITDFAKSGRPGWEKNSYRGAAVWLNQTGLGMAPDFVKRRRCQLLRKIWPEGQED